MKYKLIPENKEVKNNRAAQKLPFSFGKTVSAMANASPAPAKSARNVAFGFCSLVIIIPSLFTKISSFIKRVLLARTTDSGTKIIVEHIISLERAIKPRPVLANTAEAIPKLIPNQNTKFQNLSFVSHLGWILSTLFKANCGFVKSCIIELFNCLKSLTYIVPKVQLLTKELLVVCGILMLVFPNISLGKTQKEISEIIAKKEREYNIPSGLLLAVAKTESNLNPFALNINGKPLYFTCKDKAMKAINEAIASGVVNIDIGISQINYRWHGQNFTSIDSMLSIDTNLSYAAATLTRLKLKHGDWHKALRHYHSAKPIHHKVYSQKVVACWLGI